MNETEKTAVRNALVLAMVDGRISDEEKQFIHRLRTKCGIDGDEFRALCEQVQANRKRLEIPTKGLAAEQMLGLLLDTAKADGDMSADEQRMLEKVAAFIDRGAWEAETAVAGAADEQAAVDDELAVKINAGIDEMYAGFAEWSPDERRSHCEALGSHGAAAVIPLLRVVESYRNPDGGEGHLMKAMVIEQLAAIGDDRVVYYLAQQVSLSDTEDEVTSAALRTAAAEAIGKITGSGFTRDEAGVLACREWWADKGTKTYRTLVL